MKNTTNMPMYNTTYHEPRDYIIYSLDKRAEIIRNANSFKDALYEVCKRDGDNALVSSYVFEKTFGKFDDNDISGITSLYNRLCGYMITKVYLSEPIYDSEEG